MLYLEPWWLAFTRHDPTVVPGSMRESSASSSAPFHVSSPASPLRVKATVPGSILSSVDTEFAAAAGRSGRDGRLVKVEPLLGLELKREALLAKGLPEAQAEVLRLGGRTGRPARDERYVAELERPTGRALRPAEWAPEPIRDAYQVWRPRSSEAG